MDQWQISNKIDRPLQAGPLTYGQRLQKACRACVDVFGALTNGAPAHKRYYIAREARPPDALLQGGHCFASAKMRCIIRGMQFVQQQLAEAIASRDNKQFPVPLDTVAKLEPMRFPHDKSGATPSCLANARLGVSSLLLPLRY